MISSTTTTQRKVRQQNTVLPQQQTTTTVTGEFLLELVHTDGAILLFGEPVSDEVGISR
jgi:hypothetical protein